MTKKRHSQEFFGDQRDYWWNKDFIELMAKRWQLEKVTSVLDVGCGIGHWGQLLADFLPESCEIHGIDSEPEWVEKAATRSRQKGIRQKSQYLVGDANALPFANNSFDMVTCQTLLIHVANAKTVLGEFMRVVKPGGLIAVAEPNNLVQSALHDSLSFEDSIAERLSLLKFQMMIERGKFLLGEGHNSIGDLIPAFFAELKLQKIEVYLSDKATSILPPYEKKEEKIILQQVEAWNKDEVWIGSKDELRSFYMAAGGTELEYETERAKSLDHSKFEIGIKNQTYASAGGGIFYLVSGRK